MKPKALLCVRPDKVAIVCASCPDKHAAETWADLRGYEVSHGSCPACKDRFMEQVRLYKQLNPVP